MRAILIAGLIVFGTVAAAQQPSLPATDLTSAEINAFIDKLPKDAISDLPIKVVDVGGYRVGVYGVFRPKSVKQDAVLHEVRTTEVYLMLEGAGTLVTGGKLVDERRDPKSTTVRGSRIEGGVSRRVTKGDMIVIPGRTPHWWSQLETDIKYTITRSDPDNRIPLRTGDSR
jgi:mannose-6-phosphate isomerase-like protein (cupin superfamily)